VTVARVGMAWTGAGVGVRLTGAGVLALLVTGMATRGEGALVPATAGRVRRATSRPTVTARGPAGLGPAALRRAAPGRAALRRAAPGQTALRPAALGRAALRPAALGRAEAAGPEASGTADTIARTDRDDRPEPPGRPRRGAPIGRAGQGRRGPRVNRIPPGATRTPKAITATRRGMDREPTMGGARAGPGNRAGPAKWTGLARGLVTRSGRRGVGSPAAARDL
jgi:hypothetical protein